jgi:hypothetical protein
MPENGDDSYDRHPELVAPYIPNNARTEAAAMTDTQNW